jgi:carotenoid cleavage dioxygenase-like enzyme
MSVDTNNPFLSGNFAPVHEEVTVSDLKVTGKLPPDLDGMFIRNGPNPQFPPIKNYHWFEGDGMLHGVRLREGAASYRNRYIRTRGWQAENACGKSLYGSFLDPLNIPTVLRTSWKALTRRDLMKNTGNTALVYHDERLLALWEAGEPHEIEVPELETVGAYRYDGKLKHQFTAHPKVDPDTGEMLLFGYDPFKPLISYSIVNADGQLVSTTRIKVRRPIMMHDFAITSRYTIFMDMPFTFNVMRGLRGQPVIKFEPELGARFGILPRYAKGEDIKWFEVASGFVFHTLNAYEEGDEVVLVACRTDKFPDSFFTPPNSNNGNVIDPDWKPVMYRWRINMTTGAVREEQLDDVACDFPRVNDHFVGKKMRYGYTASLMTGPNALIKYDYERGHQQLHPHGPNTIGGEGVFVPRPNPKTEDDGWVITYVHDEESNQSELIIIEASDFSAPPVARVQIPVRVPYGFHGAWIAGDILAAKTR